MIQYSEDRSRTAFRNAVYIKYNQIMDDAKRDTHNK